MDDVTSVLLLEETRMQSNFVDQGEVLAAKDTNNKWRRSKEHGIDKERSQSKLKSKKVKCYFCKKDGHMKQECEKRKTWLQKKNFSTYTVRVSSNTD